MANTLANILENKQAHLKQGKLRETLKLSPLVLDLLSPTIDCGPESMLLH